MNNDNYKRVCQNTINYLNKVGTTGIEEANILVECAMLMTQIVKGELMIISVPKGKELESNSTEE